MNNHHIKIGKIFLENNLELTTENLVKNHTELIDNFSKLGILAMIGGYLKEDKIQIADSFRSEISLLKLSRFISYVVNHPTSPKVFDFKISTSNYGSSKKQKLDSKFNYDVILCFSGGIDSTAGLLYCLDNNIKVLPLWVDFGQRNNKAEGQTIKKILNQLNLPYIKIKINIDDYVERGWEEWKHIVPARNFLFVALANSIIRLSNKKEAKIFVCSNNEEMKKWKHKDKCAYFFRECSKFFSLDSGKKIVVTTPFADFSKSEVISWWKKKWQRKFNISPLDTTTCYQNRACGRCRACFQRTFCLISAGYSEDPDLIVHPFTDPEKFILDEWLPNIKRGKVARTRVLDFYIGLEKRWEILPDYLKNHYKSIPYQTKRAIERRKNNIKNFKMQ